MKLVYGVKDKPKFAQLIILAFQQLLSIITATLVVPVIINGSCGTNMDSAAALVGAGIGTLCYILFTQKKSPVFLGSSFAFIGSMIAAFAGATSMTLGFLGLILGAVFAGLVYVVIAIVVKFAGVKWLNKIMPVAVIGPTVTIIGLSLAGNAVGDISKGSIPDVTASPLATVFCGIVTLFITILCSTYGKKTAKLIPFILGILGGYATCGILTVIGYAANIDAIKILNVQPFINLIADGVNLNTFLSAPDFTFVTAFKGIGGLTLSFGKVTITSIACALILGIIVNLVLSKAPDEE